MTAVRDPIPAELRQAIADRMAELDALTRLMKEAARPSERGDDDQDDTTKETERKGTP